jgi:DNA-binding protein H-NS
MVEFASNNLLGLPDGLISQKHFNDRTLEELEIMLKETEQLNEKIKESILIKLRQEQEEALNAINSIANKHGIAIENLSSLLGKKPKSDVKYRNPANADETWTGLGRKPKWLHEALANGHDLESFKI